MLWVLELVELSIATILRFQHWVHSSIKILTLKRDCVSGESSSSVYTQSQERRVPSSVDASSPNHSNTSAPFYRTALSDVAASVKSTSLSWVRPAKEDFHQAQLNFTVAQWWDRPWDQANETNSRSTSRMLGHQDDPVDAHLCPHPPALDCTTSELSGDSDATMAWHPWPSGMGQARAERSGVGAVMGYVEGGGEADNGRGGVGCWGAIVSPQVRRPHFSPACVSARGSGTPPSQYFGGIEDRSGCRAFRNPYIFFLLGLIRWIKLRSVAGKWSDVVIQSLGAEP
jgi:hypothetical protein